MPRPHFLCCLPIRLGAFFVSLIELGISGVLAGILWAALAYHNSDDADTDLTRRQKIGIGLMGAGYTIMFLVAVFGLIGVIRQKISWIQNFFYFLQGVFIWHIVAAIVNIVFYFTERRDSSCVLGVYRDGKCVDGNLSKGAVDAIVLVVSLVPIVVEAYGLWILSDCIKYLIHKKVSASIYPFSRPYAAVGSREEAVSLTHGNTMVFEAGNEHTKRGDV